jgi:hypothetical protein
MILTVASIKHYERGIVDMAKSTPNNKALWSRVISAAKSKFDVYPSAYANAWASKEYKKRGGTWSGADNRVKRGR